tara:strand:- start:566 stop:742 length:177 start_codon:yes stop_codon:yes gene_type:complete
MKDNDNVIEVDFPQTENEEEEKIEIKRLDANKVFKIVAAAILALNAFNIYLYFTLIKT